MWSGCKPLSNTTAVMRLLGGSYPCTAVVGRTCRVEARFLGSSAALCNEASYSGSTSARSSKQLSNPYFPKVAYRTDYVTSKHNPVDHTFAHVGRYFSLGNDAEVKALFPDGFPRGIQTEFKTTGTHSLLIRPAGVALVQHLEAWRQATARSLGTAGSSVKDVDFKVPYAGKTALDLPASQDPASLLGAPRSDAEKSELISRLSLLNLGSKHNAADPLRAAFRPFRLLTGPIGVGKSAILSYVVAYARMNNWLTLVIPDSWKVMHEGLVLARSQRRPGFVDQHDISWAILKHMLEAQGEQLAAVPQKGVYASFRYLPRDLDTKVTAQRDKARAVEEEEKRRLKAEADAAGKAWDPASYKSKADDETNTNVDRSTFSLRDLVEWGVAHPTASTDALVDLISELRQVTEFPVLIAVDGINLMYEKTKYPMEGRLLMPEELSVPAAFQALGTGGFRDDFAMKRGVFLATVTQRHAKPMRLFEVANVRDQYRLRVGELTRPEIHSTLLHYHHSRKFLMLSKRDNVDAFAVEYYRTLSSGIPSELFNAALYQPI